MKFCDESSPNKNYFLYLKSFNRRRLTVLMIVCNRHSSSTAQIWFPFFLSWSLELNMPEEFKQCETYITYNYQLSYYEQVDIFINLRAT